MQQMNWSWEWNSKDGPRTISCDRIDAKYVVWTDNDFLFSVLPMGSLAFPGLYEHRLRLGGSKFCFLVWGKKPELFIDGISLEDGTEYRTRKKEILQKLMKCSLQQVCAGLAAAALVILIHLLTERGLYFIVLFLFGLAEIILGGYRMIEVGRQINAGTDKK